MYHKIFKHTLEKAKVEKRKRQKGFMEVAVDLTKGPFAHCSI